MKAVVGGVIGAVISGLLLFFAQNWWSDSQAEARQRISFDRQSDMSLSQEQLKVLSKDSSEFLTPYIQFYSATNTGTDDISDKSFSIATPYVISFSSTSLPNNNPNNVSMKYDGKVVSVKYSLFPAGSSHTFWIAARVPASLYEFTNDSTGVHVVTTAEKMQSDNDPFPWIWFGLAGACFVTLLIGIGIGEAATAQQLAKYGIDYKAITSKPPNAAPKP